jgi:hypothetical protein
MRAINSRVDAIASDFGNRFDEIVRREGREEDMARMIENELAGVINTIRSLRPEKFRPGAFAPIEEMYEQTRNNNQNGFYQSAIATGQQCIACASRLESELAFLNAIFSERLKVARSGASEIQTRIDSFIGAAEPHTFELDGESHTFAYDIDYWSHEAFSAIRARFDGLNGRLDGAEDAADINIEALEGIINDFGHVDDDITACNDLALRALEGSQLTIETAQRLDNALAAQGWIRGDNGNYCGEEREPFCMQYEDGSGNRVSIVVSADSADESEFSIDVYPVREDDEDFRRVIRDDLRSALRASGDIEIPSVEEHDDCGENPTPEAFAENRGRAYSEAQRSAFETLRQPQQ